MSSSTLIILEMSITLVAVVAWGVWELYKLKKRLVSYTFNTPVIPVAAF